MTPAESPAPAPLDGGLDLKTALRRVFDGQIPNYGDYNLVFASRPVSREMAETAAFVVGYRWRPAELMIAPVDLGTISGAGVPVEINMTNLARARRVGGRPTGRPGGGSGGEPVSADDGDSRGVPGSDAATFEVATSTGRAFRFGVTPRPLLDVGPGDPLMLVQDDDVADFRSFMRDFIAMA